MLGIYKANHHPKFAFLQDIRKFRERDDLPPELFDLDILDGSPPCSTFSMSGNREADWGKDKQFREGQAKQRLDDLFFEFIALADKLRPKIVVAENVKGMLIGNAKGYVKEIVRKFGKIGYDCQVFLLNAASMGVPQKRERVFFLARRRDLGLPEIRMAFKDKPIPFREVKRPNEKGYKEPTEYDKEIWGNSRPSDRLYSQVNIRMSRKASQFGACFVKDDGICNTIVSSAGSKLVSASMKRFLSIPELLRCGTFPQDYEFKGINQKYVIGMSVPPVMVARVATEIANQWLLPISHERNTP
jgi:DNA (cytosine-5)-methyltransferase 1